MEAFQDVIIVIHLMVITALIAVVLLQRSEGGALGIGGSGNFMSSRGQGNVLTRTTGVLAIAFFATSIVMTVLSRVAAPPSAILDTVPAIQAPAPAPTPSTEGAAAPAAPSTGGTGGIIDELDVFTGQSGAAGSTTTAPPAAGTTTTPPAGPQVPTSQ